MVKKWIENRFLPKDYQLVLYQEYFECTQGSWTVNAYNGEFLCLQLRCNMVEMEEQQIARYLNGLNEKIRDAITLHEMHTLVDAQSLAMKVE